MGLLHSVEELQGFSISATDGDLGKVKDAYFDDHEWTLRYLIVDTGGWLTGRDVLISPVSVKAIEWVTRSIMVDLTRQQVEDSPSIDTAKPVSRQHEVDLFQYYRYPYYWTGPYLWGITPAPGGLGQPPESMAPQEALESARGDQQLRSADEVIGYDIQATDDTIGHVEDFLFDEESWRIELMIVDTRNWWPGKQVMIPPGLIERVSWEDKSIAVKITREQVEHSDEYVPGNALPHPGGREVYKSFSARQ